MARIGICSVFFLFFLFLYPRSVVETPEPVKEEAVEVAPPLPTPTAKSASGSKKLTSDERVMALLEDCYKNYPKVVKTGYKTILTKQEWVKGKSRPNKLEVIDVDFREKPFSVFMKWRTGSLVVHSTLYIEGQNLDKHGKAQMFVQPRLLFVRPRLQAIDSQLVKDSGRYTINTFGVQWGLKRVLRVWRERHKKGLLNAEFLPSVKLKEVGNRVCYKIHRKIPRERPEEDGVLDVTLYIDAERKLQVGTILKGIRGNKTDAVLGKYFFNILELNPEYKKSDHRFRKTRLKER